MARSILRKGSAMPAGGGAEARVTRWQMETIGSGEARAAPPTAAVAEPAEPAEPALPPEADLAAIREAARAQGHAEGVAAGRAAGAREIDELAQLLGRLREVLDGFEHELAGDVLGLSLEIARQIIRHTIHVHPEVVLSVVREAIASLPQGSLHPRLLLHPEDAALVRSVLDANQITPAPWRIVEDVRVDRGGCRVETSTSELDATLGSRWKAVVAALGREERWVELEAPPRGASDAGAPA